MPEKKEFQKKFFFCLYALARGAGGMLPGTWKLVGESPRKTGENFPEILSSRIAAIVDLGLWEFRGYS